MSIWGYFKYYIIVSELMTHDQNINIVLIKTIAVFWIYLYNFPYLRNTCL